jgi:hypothetical protein
MKNILKKCVSQDKKLVLIRRVSRQAVKVVFFFVHVKVVFNLTFN